MLVIRKIKEWLEVYKKSEEDGRKILGVDKKDLVERKINGIEESWGWYFE